ncbi:MAG: gliding motility-associated C-terminal domain-containing protein [Saprospiraceae bacterium]
MKVSLQVILFVVFTFTSFSILNAQFSGTAPYAPERGGLIINEVSNGEGGNNVKEYVELVVIGAIDAPSAPVDLDGWILDDNNIAISGQGSATGHLIFGDCYTAVNPGSIFLVYNALDRNPSLPPDDPTDANRDGVYIIPHNSDCLRGCNVTPSSSSSLYCPCPDTGEDLASWPLGLRNEGDVVQVRNRCESVVHAIYWGGVSITSEVANSPTAIDIGTQSQSGRLFAFVNTNDDNWDDEANYEIRNFTNAETPGLPNSPANAAFIQQVANGTFSPSGQVALCYDTDAGDILLPADAGFFTSPIELCSGTDIGPFQTTYVKDDENVPDAPGFNYEYAFILTQDINRVFTILDFNLDGDFDFSNRPVGTYQVWGFSYILTNGSISVSDFLASGFNSIADIQAYSECGYDGNIDNLDTLGNAVTVVIFDGLSNNFDLPPLVQCEESNGQALFDLTVYNDSLSANLEITWHEDEETAITIDRPDSFVTTSTIVYAVIDNDFCETAPIPLELIVENQPLIKAPLSPLVRCEESDGKATFNLNTLTDSIIVANATTLSWFEDEAASTPISDPSAFLSESTTVFATVEQENCETEPVAVSLIVSSIAAISIDISQEIQCQGGDQGALTINTSDLLATLSFDWNVDALDGNAAPTNLIAGNYAVTVTNAAGCTQTAEMILSEPTVLQLSCSEAMPASAADLSDGEASITIMGGTAPYVLSWAGPVQGNQNVTTEGSTNLAGLAVGDYIVTILDANNCESECQFSLSFAPPVCDLQQALDMKFITCAGDSDAAVTYNISGGRAPYTILWADGDTAFTKTDLPAGGYENIITDANGCTLQNLLTITDPLPLTAAISTIPAGCESPTQVIINDISGGYETYSFSPDGNFFTPINTLPFAFDGLAPGDYTIQIRDLAGCVVSEAVTIEAGGELLLELGQDLNIQLGDSLVLKPILNFTPVSVSWSPEEGVLIGDDLNAVLRPTHTTTYTLTLTDAGGCSISDKITIFVDRTRPLFIPNAFSPNGDGANDTFTLYAGKSVESITQLRIFDRWGNLLFERQDFQPNNPELGWDGNFRSQTMNPGVFTYMFKVLYMDNTEEIITGEVTLIR